MARALLRHLTAAAPGRDQAPPGGRGIPPADIDARRPGSRLTADSARAWPIQAGTAVRRRAVSRSVAQPDQEVITVSAIPARPPRTTRLARTLGLDGNPLHWATDRAMIWIRIGLLAAFLAGGPLAAIGAGHWMYHAG
jgi:hypothetical protein